MTHTDRQEIINYLSGPRPFLEGAALYNRHGYNLRLKRLFAVDDSQFSRELLFEELRKLAGLSEVEFHRLPRKAAETVAPRSSSPAINFADDENVPEETSDYDAAPATVKKMIRFRDRFPFLSSQDCPEVLKILVADMFTSYDRYKSARARLADIDDADSDAAMKECEQVIEEYLENRRIWEELEYYAKHGVILGKHPKTAPQGSEADELAALSEIDLMKQLQSAASNQSKHRKSMRLAQEAGEKDPRAEAAFKKWSERKAMLQQEVERRKKKS